MREELLTPEAGPLEVTEEVGLRPRRLDEFVGQTALKEHLGILLEAARRRGQAADHVLVAGPPGLGKPVAEDTLVLMADGARRRIADIAEGDWVISHEGVPRRVSAVFDQGELACLRIRTHCGREVVAATDHPFLTPLAWKKAADLEVGDVLANLATPSTRPHHPDTSPDLFRLAGYFVGDGNCVQARITAGDPEVIEDIERCAAAVGFTVRRITNSPHSDNLCFSGARPFLREWGLAGKRSHEKRVPDQVFQASPWQMLNFVTGYFMSDGTVSRHGRDRYDVLIEFYSVSRGLLVDVQHLLLRLGIQSRLKLKNGKYQGARHVSWRLSITSQDDAARFLEQVPLVGQKAAQLRTWPPKRTKFDEWLLADPIVEIADAGLVRCRCITVDDDRTYTVNDLVCHNTTLAGIVAAEMSAGLRVTSGPAIERTGDLAAILTNLDEGDVLFIDEIHRLSRAVEEVLYPAMEDFQLDIVIGKGPSARSIRLDLPRFTLVGATTRTGMVTGPLRDRFGFVARVDYYEPAELGSILERAARILGVELESAGATEIAGRARGTPRIAIRLLKRVRDFAEVRGDGIVTHAAAQAGLALYEVDELGLDKLDRAILTTVCERFGGGPVGLGTLALSVGEEPETVEDVYEPFLLQRGLLQRTPRGRLATPAAWAHLGLPVPQRPHALFE
jgi:Holliday junction DNA helicase RuvB subunit